MADATKPEHAEWIKANVRGDGYGECHKMSAAMKKAFPDLREVKGFFHCFWGSRQHGWLVDQDGTIVDPTRAQFPGFGVYEEIKPEDFATRIPSGRCMGCGDDVFGGETFCSDSCEESTRAELGLE